MNIEIAEINDIPEIVAIQKLAFYDVAKFHNNFRLGPLQTTISDLESSFDSYTYFKLLIEGQIVGSLRVKVKSNFCKIENVIVHPHFQGQGLGKSLMLHLETAFPECSIFELFTGKNTPKNIPFYQSLGYHITSEIPATEKEPILVIMEKRKSLKV